MNLRGISDHAPLLADWGAGHQAQRPTWRLNDWYLKFLECAEFVEEELEAFFCSNEGPWIRRRRCGRHLETKLLELEGLTGHLDTQAVQRQLTLAWSELRQISIEEAKQCWQAATSRVYGMGDKSALLPGNVELEAIAQAFATYYQDLYAREPLPRLAEKGSVAWDLPVPTIPSNLVQDLDQPLRAEEVDTAIYLSSTGAEPNGYPIEYYKRFGHCWCLIF
ncbi:hypothetical protein NDU88_004397 [Pleurodeles waltl]|uniref:Uncharacterized protein n=1 Tax=Pleurodeles waltl TaxID=8319 RepID=A0AAV7W8Z0_PLEWA|nr:hypothetical protein NDU88_004397 [Pleurodeles waltl]